MLREAFPAYCYKVHASRTVESWYRGVDALTGRTQRAELSVVEGLYDAEAVELPNELAPDSGLDPVTARQMPR